jgi:hypothetical protein
MRDGKRRPHRGEFFRVAYAPDFASRNDARMGPPLTRTDHRLCRPAGIADRDGIRAAAAGAIGAAIIEADDDIGGIDDASPALLDVAIADDHDFPDHPSCSSYLRALSALSCVCP